MVIIMLGINEIIKEKLNKLKAELENVYSRIQADYLLGDIKSLANEAAAFGITVDVSGLEKAVETKVKSFEVDKDIDKIQDQEEKLLAAKRLQELIQREEETQKKILELNNLYKNFEQNINKNIDWYKEKNKDLDKVTNKLKNEGVVDHDLLDRNLLSHEEIKEKHMRHKQIYADNEKVNAEYKQIHNELKGINHEIKKVKEQLKRKNLKPEEVKNLQDELAYNQEMLKIYMPLVEKINHVKKQSDKGVAEHETHKLAHQEEIEKLGKVIAAYHEKEPTKYQDAKEKHQALQNQHAAIMSNGVVKDIEHHNKVLNWQAASKIKKQIQGKEQGENYTTTLSPSKTPSSNLPNSKTRTI